MREIAIREEINGMERYKNWDKSDKIVLENLIPVCSWAANENGAILVFNGYEWCFPLHSHSFSVISS